MPRCPCRRGDPPHYQDAVNMVYECSMPYPVRRKVLADMEAAMNTGGTPKDKQIWGGQAMG